jgi:hypothetical protein
MAAQQQFDWADDRSTQMLTSGTFQANEEVPRGTLLLDGKLKVLELMGFEPMTCWSSACLGKGPLPMCHVLVLDTITHHVGFTL